jgi:hypothetical protein
MIARISNNDEWIFSQARVPAVHMVGREKLPGRSGLLLLLYPCGVVARRYFKPGRVWF